MLSVKARTTDHRFFKTSIWLVTALNYKEAGDIQHQLVQLPVL